MIEMGFKFINNMPQINQSLESAVARAIEQSGQIVVNEVKRMVSGSGKGRIYRLSSGRTHQASAPGAPPALMTGALRNSYSHYVEGSGWNTKATVGSPLKYAPMLEKGTSKMAPRPHLAPSAVNMAYQVEKKFEKLI